MAETSRLIDVSHAIEDGMVTYRGLPGPVITDHLTRAASRPRYAPGTEFHIGRIEMVGNTGTYVDSPFHRYADGKDLAALPLESLANLRCVVARVVGAEGPIDRLPVTEAAARGAAVLVHTGWDRHWRTDRYAEGHPYLTGELARWLAELPDPVTVLGSQPLLGRYSATVAEPLAAALAAGRSTAAALAALDARRLADEELRRFGDPAVLLANVNGPADLDRAERLLAAGGRSGAS
jgi:kynurenine formamidase